MEKDIRAPSHSPTGQKDVKWAEGLRGLAAFLVMTSHLSLAFFETLNDPAESESKRGSIFHLPFLRLPATGSPWLALFFLLTGYVNAIKPIKQARSGNTQAALSGLVSSAFRRPWRLILPTTIATFIAWLMANLGFFSLGRRCPSWWMRDTSPPPDATFHDAIRGLFTAIYHTWWGGGANIYDKNQWPMFSLLKGSMLLYVVLLATMRCTPRYRMLVFVALYIYSYGTGDNMLGMNVYSGAFLAELHMTLPSARTPQRTLLAALLLPSGLLAASFPSNHWEWASWSRLLAHIGFAIFPTGVDHYRQWPSLGIQLLTLAIILSPTLQRALSHPYLLWLGGVSFPLYLLHGPLVRSVLVWLLFGFRAPEALETKHADGSVAEGWEVLPKPTGWMFVVCIPLWFVLLGLCCEGWNRWVEPWCASVTTAAEERSCRSEEGEAGRANGSFV